MKINIQVLYSALRDTVELKKKSVRQELSNSFNFPNLSENIQAPMTAHGCSHPRKIIRTVWK